MRVQYYAVPSKRKAEPNKGIPVARRLTPFLNSHGTRCALSADHCILQEGPPAASAAAGAAAPAVAQERLRSADASASATAAAMQRSQPADTLKDLPPTASSPTLRLGAQTRRGQALHAARVSYAIKVQVFTGHSLGSWGTRTTYMWLDSLR